ncbi:hypothetical protein [Streptomyces chattanoogensis]|uniref:RNA polymerase sigma factor 70 region 4 type 2 domain-containing protein n=1 Tax=Streptomyces chattanoogensis TaxID=66876 RepID=A0A0N0GZI0_9ACTN|nr:hypothetical protein [Streptomyces chattanoogensis]KPC62510.1 hypothetical protein ADL29_18440 [Streptomyces chattanoogensis]
MIRDHQGVHRPDLFRLEYAAFCEANQDSYLRYALVRIEDQAEARRCVNAVLEALRSSWVAVLASECPAARVWKNLRTEAAHRTIGAVERTGRLHAILRDDQADILLLHHHLRLPVDHAACLMGIADHDAHALLRGAERDFITLLNR